MPCAYTPPVASVSFTTVPKPANPGGVMFIEVPKRVVAAIGGDKKRVPVTVTINGVRYPSMIAVYGGKCFLPVRKEIRDAAKVAVGKRMAVRLAPDTAPRTVEVPRDLAAALDRAGLRETFDGLSFSHRKEYADWIASAKQAETRGRRIGRAVDMMRSETPTPK